MKILCVDTSSRRNWVALFDNGKVTDCVGYEDRQSCLINLIPSISLVLENARTPLASIDAIATIIGPGAWSSLRIGAATIKQLCLANRIPLFAISNLDLLAELHLKMNPGTFYILSTLDAQGGKVYTALYQIDSLTVTRISDYMWASPEDVVANIPANIEHLSIVGDGALLFQDKVSPTWPLHDLPFQQDSGYLTTFGQLAAMAQPTYVYEDILALKPLYVQPSSAEIEFNVSVT